MVNTVFNKIVIPSTTTSSVKKAKKLGLKPALSTGKPKFFIGWDASVKKLFKANATITQTGEAVIVTPTGHKINYDTFKFRMDLLRNGERIETEISFRRFAKKVGYSNMFVNVHADNDLKKQARFEQFDEYDMFGYNRYTTDPRTGKKVLLADYVRAHLRDEKGRFAKFDSSKAKAIATGYTEGGKSYTVYRYQMTPTKYIQWKRYNSDDIIRMERGANGSIVQTN